MAENTEIVKIDSHSELNEPYPPGLVYDLAVGMLSEKEIMDSYGISSEQARKLKENPIFRADLERMVERIKRDGLSTELKARMIVELNLPMLHRIINDENTPPAAKVNAFETAMDLAGYKGKTISGQNSGFSLNIHIGDNVDTKND